MEYSGSLEIFENDGGGVGLVTLLKIHLFIYLF